MVFCGLSAIITLLTPKKYSAEGVVYPTSSNNINEVTANPEFGFELQADKLIQLFDSQEMQSKIITQYNLVDYYELDSSSIDWKHKLNKYYRRDFTFSRTKYLSIVVNATTKDPYLSANIVNTMISYVDTVRQNIFFENVLSLKASLYKQVTIHQKNVDSLLKAINENIGKETKSPLAESNLNKINFAKQTGKMNTGDAVIANAIINNYSIELENTINEYKLALGQLNLYKTELAKVQKTLSLPFPSIYKVKMAEVDLKKVSPSLFINLVYAILAGLLFSITYITIKHNWSRIKASLTE